MYLADTLSRTYLPEVNACDLINELEEIDNKQYLVVSEDRWQQIRHASADDPVLQQLQVTLCFFLPESKSDLPEAFYPYCDHRDTVTVQDNMVVKGQLLVILACLWKEVMAVAHSTHIGIEGCLHQARESLYWPRMSTQLLEYVAKCNICLSHQTAQQKEP